MARAKRVVPPTPPVTLASPEDEGVPELTALPEQTLQAILDGFSKYIPGIIETLGMASQPQPDGMGGMRPGDTDAAKKALDFLGKAMAGTKAEGRAASTLAAIAKLRAASDDE